MLSTSWNFSQKSTKIITPGFFLDILKKTQGQKNSRFRKNSSSFSKNSRIFSKNSSFRQLLNFKVAIPFFLRLRRNSSGWPLPKKNQQSHFFLSFQQAQISLKFKGRWFTSRREILNNSFRSLKTSQRTREKTSKILQKTLKEFEKTQGIFQKTQGIFQKKLKDFFKKLKEIFKKLKKSPTFCWNLLRKNVQKKSLH